MNFHKVAFGKCLLWIKLITIIISFVIRNLFYGDYVMVSKNWEEVVSKLENYDLNNLLNQEFIDDLNEIIDINEDISCVNISLIVRGDVVEIENNNVKEININCDNIVDTIIKTIYLNTDYKQDEIKEIIEKYGKLD